MKLFLNKSFIIILCIALFFTVIPTAWVIMGRTDLIRSSVNVIAFPFRWIGQQIYKGVSGFASYFSSVDTLLERQEELSKENESLKAQLYDQQRIKKENENLKEYIGLDQQNDEQKWIAAQVVAVNEQFWTINRGSEAGIVSGRPVIDHNGAVGTVISSGIGWAYIKPFWTPGAALSAIDVNTGVLGEISGTTGLSNKGSCKLTGLTETAVFKTDDMIVSSGKGSIWTANIPIGVVRDVTYDSALRTAVAIVEIAAEMNNPGVVLVLAGVES